MAESLLISYSAILWASGESAEGIAVNAESTNAVSKIPSPRYTVPIPVPPAPVLAAAIAIVKVSTVQATPALGTKSILRGPVDIDAI